MPPGVGASTTTTTTSPDLSLATTDPPLSLDDGTAMVFHSAVGLAIDDVDSFQLALDTNFEAVRDTFEAAIVESYPPFATGIIEIDSIEILDEAEVVAGVAGARRLQGRRRLQGKRRGSVVVDFMATLPIDLAKASGVSDASIEVGLKANLVTKLAVKLEENKDLIGVDLSGVSVTVDSFMSHEHLPGVVYSPVHEFVNAPTTPPPTVKRAGLSTGHIVALVLALVAIGGWGCVRKRRRPKYVDVKAYCVRTMERLRRLLWLVAGQSRDSRFSTGGWNDGEDPRPSQDEQDLEVGEQPQWGTDQVPDEGGAGDVPGFRASTLSGAPAGSGGEDWGQGDEFAAADFASADDEIIAVEEYVDVDLDASPTESFGASAEVGTFVVRRASL